VNTDNSTVCSSTVSLLYVSDRSVKLPTLCC